MCALHDSEAPFCAVSATTHLQLLTLYVRARSAPPLLPRSQEEKKSLKGHFDLRNVEKIEPVSGDDTVAAAGADAVNLWIAEEGKSTKVMTISFMDDAFKHRDAWLTLWCSAVGANGVAGPLASFVDPALTAELNERYGLAVAVSRQRSVFSKKLRITKILTPRGSSIEVPGPSTALDTTRGTAELPPPAPLSPPAQDETITFEITVPDGVKPGDRLQATTPTGAKVKLVVPEGAEPGMLLTFQVPKDGGKKKKKEFLAQERSAILIQKHMRGAQARKQVPKPKVEKPAVVGPSPQEALDKAATKVQSSYRGLATRSKISNKRQADARLQMLSYHLETMDFAQAAQLAITPEEEALVEAKKKAWQDKQTVDLSSGIEEEARRRKWFKHFLLSNDFASAAELAYTKVDKAQLLKGQSLAAARCCSCLPKLEIEIERAKQFHAAVRSSEFEVAEVLAINGEELQDVADSRVRVEHFRAACEAGNLDEARQLAILEVEYDVVATLERARVSGPKTSAPALAKAVEPAVAKAVEPAVEPALEKAAVRVQSFVRGHQARDSQEEVRRIEWLRFLAVEGKYADALKLAIKPAEEAAVKQMQSGDVEGGTRKLVEATAPKSAPPSQTPKVAAAAKPSFSDAIKAYDWGLGAELASSEQDRKDLADSKARVEWMAKYVKEGDVQRAKSLAITEAEVERIDWQAKYGEVAFTEAIKAYKWQVATQLATSAQQRQDVLDSKARVEHLHKHLALRDWDLALQMAITPAEEAVIAKARAQSCQS